MKPRMLLLFLLVSCVSAPADTREPLAEGTAAARPPAERDYEAVLYARDGTPVDAGGGRSQEPGALPPTRELAGDPGGRMYILELYQNVIEDRDRLALEVDALGAELERARAALTAADQRIAELERALAAAAGESERQKAENVDLAGRLATAQIRRLQAEKILLELRLSEIEAARAEPDAGERGAEHP
jgi:hypothetical protein